ncbi:hypothetical protein P8935_06370 [Telmatobacter sp. DSM 110680]|uniref:Uncharacterized protein n=1 Tax=Telmatobacter sp. DSM 110680 TaxID=3036704 RepID=A0AAU7DNP1_9BACT
MSSRMFKASFTRPTSFAVALVFTAAVACAQYPGQVAKKTKDSPDLRAIAVLEWTGDEGKPKTSRLVPITVYDGQALQDGNVYLARPQPMALAGGVEYQLEKNGQPIGLYDIKNAGQEQGLWVGYGAWKPTPSAKPAAPKPIVDDGFDPNDDKPVLHRKHADASAKPGSGTDSSSNTGSAGPAPDPDRPTLHKKTGSDDSSGSSTSPAADPDRPTLHKKNSDDAASSTQSEDPNRPVLHKSASSANSSDGEHLNSTDPDRPKLLRGKPTGKGVDVLPSLMGIPADMQQAVAVSDAKARPEHPWNYVWANPDDQEKMKKALEDMARDALGLRTPPPPTKRVSAKLHAKPATAPEPPALVDERFRVFELAYGSGATMVLSARTDAPAAQQKFVTIIAQPDLYGNALVLLKSVTDNAHLDETPRMRLVDAVDALADNRGELLFELRGTTQRQFALYRVLRGTAEKIFVTGGGEYGVAPGD